MAISDERLASIEVRATAYGETPPDQARDLLRGRLGARSAYDLGPDALRWWDSEHAGEPFPERGVRVHLSDRKGGDPAEWPDELRVREWPEVTP